MRGYNDDSNLVRWHLQAVVFVCGLQAVLKTKCGTIFHCGIPYFRNAFLTVRNIVKTVKGLLFTVVEMGFVG